MRLTPIAIQNIAELSESKDKLVKQIMSVYQLTATTAREVAACVMTKDELSVEGLPLKFHNKEVAVYNDQGEPGNKIPNPFWDAFSMLTRVILLGANKDPKVTPYKATFKVKSHFSAERKSIKKKAEELNTLASCGDNVVIIPTRTLDFIKGKLTWEDDPENLGFCRLAISPETKILTPRTNNLDMA